MFYMIKTFLYVSCKNTLRWECSGFWNSWNGL